MKRVYLIWFFKKALPYVLADFVVFAVFLYFIGQFVFVQVVLDNLSRLVFSNPGGLTSYVLGALFDTGFAVQISLAGALAAGALGFKNVFSAFREETNIRQGAFY